MDIMTIYLGFFGVCILLALGWFIGKWGDIEWRCKFMRMLRRKEYFVVRILSDDENSLRAKLIQPGKDGTIELPGMLWHFSSEQIYRSVKEDSGVVYDKPVNKDITKQVEKKEGFEIKTVRIKWNEGVPTIFVSMRSIKPLTFHQNTTQVNPEEMSADLYAWTTNQINKGVNDALKALKSVTMYQIITMGLCVFILLGVAAIYMEMGDLTKTVNTINGKTASTPATLPTGQTYQNGSIVIKQGTP